MIYEMKLNKEFDIFDVIAESRINIINNRNKYRREVIDVLFLRYSI